MTDDGSLGSFSVCDVAAGESVVPGEERAHRLTTSAAAALSVPAPPALGSGVRVMRDSVPARWMPLRRSVGGNLTWRGLNLVALRDIRAGEELLLAVAGS